MDDTERALARLDLLTSPPGAALLARLAATGPTADNELALATELRREYPAELASAAMGLHELRWRARAKFTRADRMWLTRDGLEQASAERVARHRAARYAAALRVADLCCGIGGDLIALADRRPPHTEPDSRPDTTRLDRGHRARDLDTEPWVLAVDRDPVHLRMALLNAQVYQVSGRISSQCVDVRDAKLAGVEAVFIDPARRAGGRRMRAGDSDPPLDWCLGLTDRVPAVGIKAAPGLDRGRVPAGWEIEFVATGRELKEAVLWSPALSGGVPSRATVLAAEYTHELLPEPGPGVPVRPPGEFLLDPNPAVTRAGLVEDLARQLGAWKIDERIAFLSADTPARTPFGRALRVCDSFPWREKELARRLRQHDIGPLDIRRRGLSGDVAALRRKLATNGSTPATLVMTRVGEHPWALLCVNL